MTNPITPALETVTAPAARAQQRVYRPELDALRFMAFLCVFLFHTLNTSSTGAIMHHSTLGRVLPVFRESLGFGLCLFFFLSSFLITSLLEVEKGRTGTIDLQKFYVRRVLRIWPLYFFFLAAMYALGLWWQPASLEPLRLLGMTLLAGNWFSIFFGMGSVSISHLWSISVEEQFYVLWPSLSRALSAPLIAVACCTIALISLALAWILAARGSGTLPIWLNSIVQSIFFASGALLALRVGLREQRKCLLRALAFIAAGFSLWLVTASYCGLDVPAEAALPWRITSGYLLVVLGCALLLNGFLHLPKVLLSPFLLYLGRISYGLHVFHAAVLAATRPLLGDFTTRLHLPGVLMLIQLLLTVAMAAISYQVLEKPFLRLKSRFELVRTRAV